MQQSAGPPETALAPPSETYTLSVRTSIVAITALVRNKKGELIRDLDQDQFQVKQDGKPVAIKYFEKDSDLPLQIGFLIDTSDSQRRFFNEERRASYTFLDSMLTRAQDQAYVVRFDYNLLLLQPMTPDVAKLKQSMTLLEKDFPLQKGADYKRGTRLYDAICSTTKNVANRERGRRAIVILTDGEDNGSILDLRGAIACVQYADTPVYTVLYTDKRDIPVNADAQRIIELSKGSLNGTQRPTGRSAMDMISLQSGGRLFLIQKDMPVEKIFQQIELDMRMQYRFGYTPTPSKPGTYHSLEVKPKDSKYAVQARVGFYTPQ